MLEYHSKIIRQIARKKSEILRERYTKVSSFFLQTIRHNTQSFHPKFSPFKAKLLSHATHKDANNGDDCNSKCLQKDHTVHQWIFYGKWGMVNHYDTYNQTLSAILFVEVFMVIVMMVVVAERNLSPNTGTKVQIFPP